MQNAARGPTSPLYVPVFVYSAYRLHCGERSAGFVSRVGEHTWLACMQRSRQLLQAASSKCTCARHGPPEHV